MVVLKVRPGLFFLEGIFGDSNTVVFPKQGVLVDTGTGIRIGELLKQLSACGLSQEKVKKVVNTHCHVDHIGGNRYFKASFLAHEFDADAIRTADPVKTLSSFFPAKLQLCEVESVRHGDILRIGEYSFKILHTPGHTEGSMCLWEPEEKILVSGDTVFGGLGVGRTDLPTGNPVDLAKSLKSLSELNAEVLLPGHGSPVLEKAFLEIRKSSGFFAYY